jgi:hypothetical protein
MFYVLTWLAVLIVLYPPHIIGRTRQVEPIARLREMRNIYRICVGNSEGKILLERYSHRWKDNIKMGPEERTREYGLDSSGPPWGEEISSSLTW